MPKAISPGQIVATPGALALLERTGTHDQLPIFLREHLQGRCPHLDDFDQQANFHAIREGRRVLTTWPVTDHDNIWIITEWNRSVTTILLPSEY